MSETRPKRGEIWWVDFDPTRGSETAKTRPAVVVNTDAVSSLPVRLVIPLTQWPYIFLNRPFVQGPGISELIAEAELKLHPAPAGLFPYEKLHTFRKRHSEASSEERTSFSPQERVRAKPKPFCCPSSTTA